MLQSLIVYGILAFILWRLGLTSAKRERIHDARGTVAPFWVWDIVIALLLFAFVSGIRWQVGVDHLSYLQGYKNLLMGFEFRTSGIEPGFNYISELFAFFDIHFTFYFAFWAFLQLFLIYYAVRKERYLLPFVGIVIVMGPHYLSWMNGIRQMLVACIFVYAVEFIKNKKLFNYLILILLASLIHKSAILLLAFYFIPHKNYFRNRYITLALLTSSVIVGLNPDYLRAIEGIENILGFLGYDRYSEQLDNLVSSTREMSFGPRRYIVFLISVFIIWYSTRLKQKFQNTNFLIYYNFTIFGAILFNLFANTSHLFLRPVSYFTIFSVLVLSYLLRYLKTKPQKELSPQFLLIFTITVSYLLISIYADYGKDPDYTNFKFFWNYV